MGYITEKTDTQWIPPEKYWELLQMKTKVQFLLDDRSQPGSIEQIVNLKPYMQFFSLNIASGDERAEKEMLKRVSDTVTDFSEVRHYRLTWKGDTHPTFNFQKTLRPKITVGRLPITPRVNFSALRIETLEYAVQQDRLHRFKAEFGRSYHEMRSMAKERDPKIQSRMDEIEKYSITLPDSSAFGDWIYYDLAFYMDSSRKYYIEGRFYEIQDQRTVVFFAPMDPSLLGKFLNYAEQCGLYLGYFVINPLFLLILKKTNHLYIDSFETASRALNFQP
ncbi:hypothetical protein NEF87_004881 [Candidatus Lokiarchaeum ossiferum]|uniref:GNAT family N-acetyltransferase n=1 Tax=Candidatus Lokiarchaeum ossiferum TaxID=2951803 RepID=A0ABY6HYJ0_9ARCH|nr:hypothetical protein NEF87_004881 [Candidatus Lokiarchaeum sp. B-35]